VAIPPRTPSLPRALALLSLAWAVLLAAARGLEPALGPSGATCAAFAAATALCVAARGGARVRPRALALALCGAASGFGLRACAPGLLPAGGAQLDPPLAAAAVLLAPVFEEILYRERLIPALAPALGALPAVALSSALFAATHFEPTAALVAFAGGLALGALFQATRSLALCIGCHLGFNLGALAGGAT
jgi:membrane protease YdiL (CAAX protease family)